MANISTSGDTLEADAFKRLYPSQFYSRFIANSVRPDGRPLMRSSDISIGLNAVTTSASSALVKIGTTTALAGIKLEVFNSKIDYLFFGNVRTLYKIEYFLLR